jgi:hypothetical protein
MLFNCISSSGIGRTGTFILLDILFESLNHSDEINIIQVLSCCNMQRSNFVETWEQYKFVIYALLVRYLFGKTDISQDGIDLAMNRLNAISEKRNKTYLELEYEVNKFKTFL